MSETVNNYYGQPKQYALPYGMQRF
ncbi:hypothetical protein ACP8HI_26235 [Paenibacillus sp. FA6]